MHSPRYIFSNLGPVLEKVRDSFIYLFLDFDGTLAPIASTPGGASISAGAKNILRSLAKAKNCKVAIVSGRALSDVSKRVGLKGVVYVGNHGFEVTGPKINFKSPVSLKYRKVLEEIKSKLKKNLSGYKKILIEDKGFSLSLHYRLAEKKDRLTIENEFYATILPYEVRNQIKVKPGKMVLEAAPPVPWNKGKVVLWLLGRRIFAMKNIKKILPVYVGDDITDEDAFEALKGKGVTIFVGKPSGTKAEYYLKDIREVERFLSVVQDSLKAGV